MMKFMRAILVLVGMVSASSALAVGPGLEAFEEGKGTIGMTCTQPSGRQINAMPSAASAMDACRGSRDLSGCLNQVRETSLREFADCAHGVRDQWVAQAILEGSSVSANVWTYVDGSSEYRTEMSGLQSAVISGRTARRRAAIR